MRPFSQSIALALIAALSAFGTSASAAPVAYALQKENSVVGFSWTLGPDEVTGSMPVADADISIDLEQLENTRVNVSLDVANAVAGFPFATQGMKSERVLWVEEHPRITFTSTAIARQDEGARVDGLLTVRGITRPVVFDARLFRQQGTEPGDRRLLSIIVTGRLLRSDFGADGWSGLAGDEVRLTIVARLERME